MPTNCCNHTKIRVLRARTPQRPRRGWSNATAILRANRHCARADLNQFESWAQIPGGTGVLPVAFGVPPNTPLPGSAFQRRAQESKQNDAPNHAVGVLPFAPAIAIPRNTLPQKMPETMV